MQFLIFLRVFKNFLSFHLILNFIIPINSFFPFWSLLLVGGFSQMCSGPCLCLGSHWKYHEWAGLVHWWATLWVFGGWVSKFWPCLGFCKTNWLSCSCRILCAFSALPWRLPLLCLVFSLFKHWKAPAIYPVLYVNSERTGWGNRYVISPPCC